MEAMNKWGVSPIESDRVADISTPALQFAVIKVTKKISSNHGKKNNWILS